jgi:hypothetical protein
LRRDEETDVPRFRSGIVGASPTSKRSVAAVHPPGESAGLSLHLELARQLDALPKDLGVTLLVFGALGVVIPGPVPPGFSFILLGVIALRPGILARSGAPLARRFSGVFRLLIGLVTHFRSDLARRYPGSVPAQIPVADGVGPRRGPGRRDRVSRSVKTRLICDELPARGRSRA